jgi:hypothetical protein
MDCIFYRAIYLIVVIRAAPYCSDNGKDISFASLPLFLILIELFVEKDILVFRLLHPE